MHIPAVIEQRFLSQLSQRMRGEVLPTLKATAKFLQSADLDAQRAMCTASFRLYGLRDPLHTLPPATKLIPQLHAVLFEGASLSPWAIAIATRMIVQGGMFSDPRRVAEGLLQLVALIRFSEMTAEGVVSPWGRDAAIDAKVDAALAETFQPETEDEPVTARALFARMFAMLKEDPYSDDAAYVVKKAKALAPWHGKKLKERTAEAEEAGSESADEDAAEDAAEEAGSSSAEA